jgi:hypothetical protein
VQRAQIVDSLEDLAQKSGLQIDEDHSFAIALFDYSEQVGVRELDNDEIETVLMAIGRLAINNCIRTREFYQSTLYARHVQMVFAWLGICHDPWSTCRRTAQHILENQAFYARVIQSLEEVVSTTYAGASV